jgi:uncharacterized protein (TIGR02147 family)
MSAGSESTPQPSVFDYLDYRRFLRDWFEWKRTRKKGYSYAVFARNAGFSRGVMNNVIAGRRAPTADTLNGIRKAMDLSEEEVAFMALLVESSHASTLEERATALRNVFDHPKFTRLTPSDADAVEMMSSWAGSAIAELVRLPGFDPDPEWISRRVGGRLTPEEAKRALEVCMRIGEVVDNGDGTFSRKTVRVGTGVHSTFSEMRLAHYDMLDLARESMDLPQDQRYLLTITSALSRAHVPAVQERLVNAMRSVVDLMDQARPEECEDGEVYVCAVHLFPVTGARPGDNTE